MSCSQPETSPEGDLLSPELAALSRVILDQIPLSRAMGLQLQPLEALPEGRQRLHLVAPLEPNVNDKGTAFGGALAAAMTLAGWGALWLACRRLQLDCDLVIGQCTTRYLLPVTGRIDCSCELPSEADMAAFSDTFKRRGRARTELLASVHFDLALAASLEGRYVALARKRA